MRYATIGALTYASQRVYVHIDRGPFLCRFEDILTAMTKGLDPGGVGQHALQPLETGQGLAGTRRLAGSSWSSWPPMRRT